MHSIKTRERDQMDKEVYYNCKKQHTDVYANLDGWKMNADILVSSGKASRQDLVLINRTKKIALLELTCSLPHNVTGAHNVKNATYTELKVALTEKAYMVDLLPFEVCLNGSLTNKNKQDKITTLRKFNIVRLHFCVL